MSGGDHNLNYLKLIEEWNFLALAIKKYTGNWVQQQLHVPTEANLSLSILLLCVLERWLHYQVSFPLVVTEWLPAAP